MTFGPVDFTMGFCNGEISSIVLRIGRKHKNSTLDYYQPKSERFIVALIEMVNTIAAAKVRFLSS